MINKTCRAFSRKNIFWILINFIFALEFSKNANATDAKIDKFRDAIEVFEIFCFRTEANYSRIEEMAAADKMRIAPKELLQLALGSDAAEGKGFFFNEKSLLAISKPDACGVYFEGVIFSDVELKIKENYKLHSINRDDIGIEVREMFIPGGKGESIKDEIGQSGLVSIIYPKPEFGDAGFVMSFLPPRTAELIFKPLAVPKEHLEMSSWDLWQAFFYALAAFMLALVILRQIFVFFKRKPKEEASKKIIFTLLATQLRLGGADDKATLNKLGNLWALGYIYGLHDSVFQRFEINEEKTYKIMADSYEDLFGKNGLKILSASVKMSEKKEFVEGMMTGGQEVVNFLSSKEPPLGLMKYLRAEVAK